MASWTAPTIFATGDLLDVSSANAWSNDLTFLYEAPYISCYSTAVTSVSTATWTQVALGATNFLGYGFSLTSNNAVVPLAGIYWAAGRVATVAGSNNQANAIYQNGTAKAQGVTNAAPFGNNAPVSGLLSCSASDTVGLYVYQDSGSTVDTLDSAVNTGLDMYFVGSQ